MPAVRPAAATLAIIAAGRRLGARGLISAGERNLSIRVDGGRVAITASGRRKDELRDDDLVLLGPDLNAEAARAARSTSGLGPSSDLRIHLAILAARPDVAAVAHAHLPAAMALTVAGEIPDPTVLPETALFLPRIPFLPFGEPGSRDLADRAPRRSPNRRSHSRTSSCWSGTGQSPSDPTSRPPSTGSSSWRCSAGRGRTAC